MDHRSTRRSSYAQFLIKWGEKNPKKIMRVSGAPSSTVYRLLAKKRTQSSRYQQNRLGRPPKLNPAAKDSLKRLAVRNRTSSNAVLARRLKELGHPTVSPRTVGRALTVLHMRRTWARRKPLLTEDHRRKRLDFCRRHLHTDWSKVVFTDEATFCFSPPRRRVIVAAGKPVPTDATTKRPPSVMVWGGISTRGATPLATIVGSIDSNKYQEVLKDFLVPTMDVLYEDGYVLQQDNAPPHTSAATHKFFRRQGIEVMDWPPMSPDLNPIENLWGLLKKEFAPLKRTTLFEWKEKLFALWNSVPLERLQSLVNSMPRRIDACIAANGGHTKY